MATIHQIKRMIRLEEKRQADKYEFDHRPYTQKVYNQDDKKKFPKEPEKWRVIKTISHNYRGKKN